MKKIILLLLLGVCFFNCSEKKKNLEFAKLNSTEFNAKTLGIPSGNVTDSLKQVHDSCMGFSFNANAMLIQKDTFFIGSIVNKQSLDIVNTTNNLGLTRPQLMSRFNILTTPCYEKHVIHFPLRSILKENFILQLPNIDTALNKEINDAINASNDAEMQSGSWIYLDIQNVLKSIMDTIKTTEGLRYKNDMFDTSNMVLTAVESITDISFIINTPNGISAPLQAVLKNKPTTRSPDGRFSMQLFYIDTDRFKLGFGGFFPVVGEFMKAELQ